MSHIRRDLGVLPDHGKKHHLICHECNGDECFRPEIFKCHNALACFEFKPLLEDRVEKMKKGCFYDPTMVRLYCDLTKPAKPFGTMHCCSQNFCNNNSFVPNSTSVVSNILTRFYLSPNLGICVLAGCSLLLLLLLLFCILKRSRNKRGKTIYQSQRYTVYDFVDPLSRQDKKVALESEALVTSGSGSGEVVIHDRTLYRDIIMLETIYKGRKIHVFKALWKQNTVAIKVFYSRDEDIWLREKNMYTKINNASPFVLSLLGADLFPRNSCTEFWLVSHYCQLGSLYDYLNAYSLTYPQCLSLLMSIVSGIKCLHYELDSCKIAHRDLKSKNILLLSPWVACIADFGLAVSDDEKLDSYANPAKFKVGTKRYMAPELLNETFDFKYFESFRRIDMYCFALVMWEMLRRCELNEGGADSYSLPFGGIVPSDPSFGDMRKVVCEDNQRPWISLELCKDKILSPLLPIMKSCWEGSPIERNSTIEVWQSMEEIIEKTFDHLSTDNEVQLIKKMGIFDL